MNASSRGRSRVIAAIAALVVAAPIAVAASGSPAASAAPAAVTAPVVVTAPAAPAVTGADFDPGLIISDALFYDGAAMTAAEIQSFLDAKIGRCTNGKCLNVVRVSPASQAAYISSDTGRQVCAAITGGTNLTVATWIYRVQVACGLSAKAILVTLQKEQGLVTKTAPTDYALRYAMGMDCPDTTGCQTTGGGLASQIYRGSRQLVIYKVGEFLRQPGWHAVQFHPNGACGSAMVRVQNYATAALYNYTPYQPNAAALANLGGTGDSCSSYGNRNFWRYYNDWFGSTLGAPGGSIDGGSGLYGIDADGDLTLFAGTGRASWRPGTGVGVGWGTVTQVTGVGDFDGDGHRDLLAVDGAGDLVLYPSDGGSAFGSPVVVASGWGDRVRIAAASDVNLDGFQDVFAITAAGVLQLSYGVEGGRLAPPIDVSGGWLGMTSLFGMDFTGDRKPDIVARDGSGRLWLWAGTGRAAWQRKVQIGSGWGSFRWIGTPGDFTGNGTPDVLAITAAGTVFVYPTNGRGAFTRAVQVGSGWSDYPVVAAVGDLPTGRRTPQGGVGDLTGDRARDVIARDATGKLWVYPGSGTGTFKTRIASAANWAGVTSVFGNGDVDFDGVRELYTRDATGLALRDATLAGLASSTAVAGTWDGYDIVLGAGDIDSDGDSDLLARDTSGVLWALPGDGTGAVGTPVQVGVGWGSMTALVAPGDFDGDGVPDLLARDAAGVLWLYPGTGANAWYSRVQIGVGWGIMRTLWGPGDFTGDGTVDLLAVRSDTGAMVLYTGNGSGGWSGSRVIGTGWGGMTLLG